eukprot:scaffold2408_cov386-Prasinococcus_capsulatus_cf.AAC.20
MGTILETVPDRAVPAPYMRLSAGLVEGERVQRQQFERLWEDQLPGGRVLRAVLAVRVQDGHSVRHILVAQLLQRLVGEVHADVLAHEAELRVQVRAPKQVAQHGRARQRQRVHADSALTIHCRVQVGALYRRLRALGQLVVMLELHVDALVGVDGRQVYVGGRALAEVAHVLVHCEPLTGAHAQHALQALRAHERPAHVVEQLARVQGGTEVGIAEDLAASGPAHGADSRDIHHARRGKKQVDAHLVLGCSHRKLAVGGLLRLQQLVHVSGASIARRLPAA